MRASVNDSADKENLEQFFDKLDENLNKMSSK